MERVKDDAEAIAAFGVKVLLEVADDEATRFIVFGEYPEIERVVVVDDAYFGVERAGSPSRGSFWRKWLAIGASFHAASSGRPSSVIGPEVRTAIRRRSSLAVA